MSTGSNHKLTMGTKIAIGFGCFSLIAVLAALWFLTVKVIKRSTHKTKRNSNAENLHQIGPRWFNPNTRINTHTAPKPGPFGLSARNNHVELRNAESPGIKSVSRSDVSILIQRDEVELQNESYSLGRGTRTG